MGISFGLKTKFGAAKPPGKADAKPKPSFNGFGGEDEPASDVANATGQALEISTFDADASLTIDTTASPKPESKKSIPKRPLGPPQGNVSAQHGPGLAATFVQHKQAADDEVDPSIYDYDSHYDAIHKAQNDRKAKLAEESASGKPKYMENLIAASEQRKRDQTRARDKLLQREREAEGDEFADKEKFVTEAYKKQQEETKLLEEEERKKEEAEEEKKRKQGMTGFYRDVMQEREKEHRAALEAAKNYKPGDDTNTSTEEPDVGASAAKRAAELNAQGADIMITDDGEVADKRQLLKGGLNITAKPKPKSAAASTRDTHTSAPVTGHHVDMDAKRAQRERQSRMIEEQITASQKRAAEEEAEALQKREQSLKSAKTSGDISDARARFLARKKAQAEAAAAAGKK